MSGFLGDDQVRRVKEVTDLVHLMGDYTAVRRAGHNHVCCCPFHSERSPSMHIYDDGHYHCYGCGAHGDAISLVRDKENFEFTESVEYLARRAGIQLEYQAGKGRGLDRSERDKLVEAFEMAIRFYEHVLWETSQGAEAREYLASRGLSVDVCRRFRLGWAPGGGALVEEARRRRIEVELLVKLDLVVDRNGRWGDRFFERVSFPICDRFGNPIAISGRLLPEAERRAKTEGRGVGKYINSTDTPLYHKSNVVFNLHLARAPAKEKGRLIVMEGPTDVMAAADAGVAECVAVLGTALTPEHAKQLGTIPGDGGRLLLVFDGDRAGQTNSLKAVRTCLSAGVPCWVASVPDEMDPSELLKEDAAGGGIERFERVLAEARADVDHLLRVLAPRPYELEHRDLLAVADQILEVLRPITDRELRDLYLRDLANWLGIERSRLEKRLAGAGGPGGAATGVFALVLPPACDAVCHILVRRPDLREEAFDRLGLEPSHLVETVRPLLDRLVLAPDTDAQDLLLLAEDPALAHLRPLIFRWVTSDLAERVPAIATDEEAHPVLMASIQELRLERVREALRRVTTAVSEAEKRRDMAEMGRLFREKMGLTQELADLQARFTDSG